MPYYMGVMIWHIAYMEKTLEFLQATYPEITFVPGKSFYWSAKENKITFIPTDSSRHVWSLLHEAGHATLDHVGYTTDLELLHLEIAAWGQAKALARSIRISINDEHVERCLDTYRNWLHARATCPRCLNVSLQTDINEYRCFNCKKRWQISRSRFCRIYRQQL